MKRLFCIVIWGNKSSKLKTHSEQTYNDVLSSGLFLKEQHKGPHSKDKEVMEGVRTENWASYRIGVIFCSLDRKF